MGDTDKKLFLFATGPFDQPRAWARMGDLRWIQDYVQDSLEKAGFANKPFERVRVEHHRADGTGLCEDGRIYVWGEEEPAADTSRLADHEGLYVEVDGKVVFNDLSPLEKDDEGDEHDPDCEYCKTRTKIRAVK